MSRGKARFACRAMAARAAFCAMTVRSLAPGRKNR
jgi:hypothetical protein